MLPIKKILVATDFGEISRCAVDSAVELAVKLDAQLELVHVFDIPSYVYMDGGFVGADLLTPIEEGAQKAMKTALTTVQTTLPAATGIVRRGVAWEQILDVADATHAGLIVLGTHGRRGVKRALLGSVAEKVVRFSAVPVLTIRGERAPA